MDSPLIGDSHVCSCKHTDIDQNHADNVGKTGGPEATNQRDSNKYDRTGDHATLKRKKFRQERRENRATCQILQCRDHHLNNDQANYSNDTAIFIIIPFKQFRYCCTVHFPISRRSKKSHDQSSGRPCRVVPAGGDSYRESIFRHSNRRSGADCEPCDVHSHQPRSHFTTGK